MLYKRCQGLYVDIASGYLPGISICPVCLKEDEMKLLFSFERGDWCLIAGGH